MKPKLTMLAAVAVAALLGGCAGSTPLEGLVIICGGLGSLVGCDGPDPQYGEQAPPVHFTKWSDHLGYPTFVYVEGLEVEVPYTRGADAITATSSPRLDTPEVRVTYGAPGYLQYFAVTHGASYTNWLTDLGRDIYLHGDSANPTFPGQPGIEYPRANGGNYSGHDFSALLHDTVGLVANPYALGWDYQSFGVWNRVEYGAPDAIGAESFGAVTPASAVPSSGYGYFTGKLAGMYVSPQGLASMAAGNVVVSADFSARSLTFATTDITTSQDLRTATLATNLNLSGTLTYSPVSNKFSGTLTNANGTFSGTLSGTTEGRFYGPAAQELGGVFAVKSPTTVETFTGAYGAKR